AAMRRFVRVVDPVFMLGVAMLLLGVTFGLVTAATGGWSFGAGWLTAAYVLVIAIFVVGFGMGLPYYRLVGRELESGADELTPRLSAALADLRGIGSLV